MTQCERVIDYMRKYDSITPLEAMRDLGVYRLASRIHDLKRLGHVIRTEQTKVPTRYGTTTTISKYKLG